MVVFHHMKLVYREEQRSMKIRLMKKDDYDKAYQLWSNTPGMNLNSLDNTFKGIKAVIDRNPDLCFVATEGEMVIGTALGATDGRKGYLYHVAVSEQKGQRICSQLLNLILQGFRDHGITKIGLFTTNDNLEGKSFWEHLGWHQRADITYLDRDITI